MHAWLIAALVVSWVLVFVLAGLLFVAVKKIGDLMLYQQDLDARLEMGAYQTGRNVEGALQDEAGGQQPDFSGLPLGTEAPTFALADLEGQERTLDDYLGEPFVIGFFNTDCGYCKELSPQLGKLPKKGHRLVLVSHGDLGANRTMAETDKWSCDVVVEDEWDVAAQFRAAGTPSGYLVGADGKIASPHAIGSQALLELLEMEPQVAEPGEGDGGPAEESGNGNGTGPVATPLNKRDVSQSRLARDGLKAGTIAPAFALRDLDGKTRSLLDYRGKRVLLVFTDVTCGPCEQLAPELVRLHESRPDDLEILLISRGDLEDNKRKAKTFGYPFPVLVQDGWEVSKQYAMFATPIGYLIDADGIIVEDVALGNEAILALAD
jgi:peroxiredoxin